MSALSSYEERAAELGYVPISEHAAGVQMRLEQLRIDRDARRLLDAEGEAAVDFDALFHDFHDLDDLPEPDPLIPTVLPRGSYGVLRGRDHTFKSFLALDWSLCLATGQPWYGQPVAPARVLYIAGEGAHGVNRRRKAWAEAHRRQPDRGMFELRSAALNLYAPGAAFEHLLEHIEAGRFDLVVIDTLRRVSGGADGNGSDMGEVIDNIDTIKRTTAEGSVLVLSHTDKADNDTRGYSGIEDDADFVWHARRDGERVEVELTKMKDGPDGQKVILAAREVAESLVLVPAPQVQAEGANQSEQALLETMRQAFPDGGFGGAIQETAGLPRATFYRSMGALLKAGTVVKSGSHQRPFYELASLMGREAVSGTDSPADLQDSHESQSTPTSLTSLTTLRSETHETETEIRVCPCNVPEGANLAHISGCPGFKADR